MRRLLPLVVLMPLGLLLVSALAAGAEPEAPASQPADINARLTFSRDNPIPPEPLERELSRASTAPAVVFPPGMSFVGIVTIRMKDSAAMPEGGVEYSHPEEGNPFPKRILREQLAPGGALAGFKDRVFFNRYSNPDLEQSHYQIYILGQSEADVIQTTPQVLGALDAWWRTHRTEYAQANLDRMNSAREKELALSQTNKNAIAEADRFLADLPAISDVKPLQEQIVLLSVEVEGLKARIKAATDILANLDKATLDKGPMHDSSPQRTVAENTLAMAQIDLATALAKENRLKEIVYRLQSRDEAQQERPQHESHAQWLSERMAEVQRALQTAGAPLTATVQVRYLLSEAHGPPALPK